MLTLSSFELVNSLLVLLRRKKLLAAEKARALAVLARLPLTLDDEGPRLAFGEQGGNNFSFVVVSRFGMLILWL